MNSNPILHVLVITFLFVFTEAKIAFAGSGSITNIDSSNGTPSSPENSGNSSTPPGTANPIINNTAPSINQQADFIQNNGSSFSSLTYPNCQGACIFAIGRTNSRQSWEAVAGVVWQISSPENTQAETHRLTAQSERDKLERDSTIILVEKLSDAIESGKTERANLLAIILAKRLGYSDYQRLLRESRGK
jgi:hypothetical protein